MGCVTLWVEVSHSKSSLGAPNPCDNPCGSSLLYIPTLPNLLAISIAVMDV